MKLGTNNGRKPTTVHYFLECRQIIYILNIHIMSPLTSYTGGRNVYLEAQNKVLLVNYSLIAVVKFDSYIRTSIHYILVHTHANTIVNFGWCFLGVFWMCYLLLLLFSFVFCCFLLFFVLFLLFRGSLCLLGLFCFLSLFIFAVVVLGGEVFFFISWL